MEVPLLTWKNLFACGKCTLLVSQKRVWYGIQISCFSPPLSFPQIAGGAQRVAPHPVIFYALLEVVGHEWVLNEVGRELNAVAQRTREQPNAPFPWTEVEADMFLLTTVAPRAPAGYEKKDGVF